MKPRRLTVLFLAFAAVLFAPGCAPRASAVGPEVDDAEYKRGVAANRSGEWNRALASFLAVIAERGEDNAPESQMEAGLIQLQHSKQPFDAYFRLQKYLTAKPTAPNADLVRAQLDAAHREAVLMYFGGPSQTLDNGAQQRQLMQLQKENAELKEMLRSSGSPGMMQTIGSLRTAPIESISVPGSGPETVEPPAAPALQTTLGRGAVQTAAVVAPKNTVVTPAPKPAQPAAGGATTATVQKSEGFLAIAKRVYPAPVTLADAKRIEDANKDKGALHPGMVLRIPPR